MTPDSKKSESQTISLELTVCSTIGTDTARAAVSFRPSTRFGLALLWLMDIFTCECLLRRHAENTCGQISRTRGHQRHESIQQCAKEGLCSFFAHSSHVQRKTSSHIIRVVPASTHGCGSLTACCFDSFGHAKGMWRTKDEQECERVQHEIQRRNFD